MATGHRYSAFGWTIAADQEIPDLLPTSNGNPPDLRVHLGSLPAFARMSDPAERKLWHSTVETTVEGRPLRAIWHLPNSQHYLLEYYDRHCFVFDRAATEVWAEWPQDSTLADNLCYLLGPVFGMLLTLRGIPCLHASSVQLGDGCVALVGAPEAGKSTTAAAFALRGRTVLGDDIATVELTDQGEIVVRPSYPRIRLWPRSAEVLEVPLETLPALTPTWEKRFLDLRNQGLEFGQSALPLRGVYVLQEREGSDERPYLETAPPRDQMLDLIANMYVASLPQEGRAERDFPVLREIAMRLPVRRVFGHSDPQRLPRMCELIEQDVAAHAEAAARGERV